MNFSQFLYSTAQLGIGVFIGWLLSFISQQRMQKRQQEFELEKLKVERKEPYKERLYNIRFEAYSCIWAKFLECLKEFSIKHEVFKIEDYRALMDIFENFRLEFFKNFIILKASVLIIGADLIITFYLIARNYLKICKDNKNIEAREEIKKDQQKTFELMENLGKEIRKDLKLPEIEKSLAEIFFPKEPTNAKAPKRTQSTKS